ncbi:acyltransferase [Pseudomonas sp. M2]|uniref:acyltransferase family protein n=1 Tax=Pseudomonas sp. M2 TaxID=228756 RepID=UPI0018CBD530|nr:peptidoglycan/LPS O-acetylase OafA/YrhL [Pseudomonas sp. M2]MBG6128541.1 peptidoglycan/LPS O-acetylase OafA/YrhL [Pseudomonas sp. M2]HDS1744193.1 acyltransferase [Pseudomonas putida]
MSGRIEFANSLRGIASLVVMLGHYVFVFHGLRGAYGGMTKLSEPVFPALMPFAHLGISNFAFGTFGVALFFLVSGFVIPFSLEKYSKHSFGMFRFMIARFFRLWPVYLCGFAISIAFRWISFDGSSIQDSYTAKDLFLHVTLFRDWFGGLSLDGIVWTLEVEVKFYILSAILASFTMKGKPYVAIVAGAAALAGMYYAVKFPQGWMPPSNFLYSAKFILFMTIGTQFYLVMKKIISMKAMLAYTLLSLILFVLAAPVVVRESYVLAFLVFSICYLARESFTENRFVGFFANISYPMYAMHAVFGYVSMRLMIDAGVYNYLALVIQIGITCAVAYLIHRYVEKPSQKLGSRISLIELNDRIKRKQVA